MFSLSDWVNCIQKESEFFLKKKNFRFSSTSYLTRLNMVVNIANRSMVHYLEKRFLVCYYVVKVSAVEGKSEGQCCVSVRITVVLVKLSGAQLSITAGPASDRKAVHAQRWYQF